MSESEFRLYACKTPNKWDHEIIPSESQKKSD